jgi:NADH-quinone oxidoreductase subunit L
MTVPLWVLAFGAAVVGLLGLPHNFFGIHLPNWWSGWLAPHYERFVEVTSQQIAAGVEHEEALRTGSSAAHEVTSSVATLQFQGQLVHGQDLAGYLAMGFGLTAALLGFGLAYTWYVRGDGVVPQRMMESAPRLHRFLMDKWRVDELYDLTVVNLMKWLGVFAGNLDKWFVDGLLTRVTSAAMTGAGFLVTRTQSGVVYAYAGLMVLGLGGLGWWFTYPHAALEAEPEVGQIAWEASRGLGYEYRWDYDSDGEWDTEWGDEATATHDYEGAAYYGLVGILATPRDVFEPTEIAVEAGDSPVDLPVETLTPDWAQGNDPNAVPPSLRYEEGAMVVRINGANIPDNDGTEDGMVTLHPGDSLRLGGAMFLVAVRVRGTVEVRNPFGNLARGSQDVTLRIARDAGAHARAEVHPHTGAAVGAEVVR